MFHKLILGLTSSALFFISHTTSESCHDAYECASSTISITNPNATNLECFGYSSCTNSDLLQSLTDATIQCLGSYACYGSDIVQHTHTTPATYGDIICCGLNSCASISNLYNKNGSIACDGELSCANSSINIIDDKLFCLGDRACLDANIEVSNSKVYISGYRAGENATFTSLGSSVMYDFDGVDAGINAQVICDVNQTCRIICHSSGCNNLKLTCLNEPCNWDISCSYSENNNICSSGWSWSDNININNKLTLPTLGNIGSSQNQRRLSESSDDDSTMRICEDSDLCNDYLECSGDGFNDIENNNGSSVCCSGMKSCNGEGEKIEVMLNNGEDVRCDGTMSCANLVNYSKIMINNGDGIYLSSYAAAKGTELILTGNDKDVYCTGMESCFSSIIRDGNNVYCNGGWSCKQAELIENVKGNLWAYGVSGLAKATVNNVDGNVYCGTQYSCSSAKINGVGGDVLGVGFNVMSGGVFNNVGGIVAALGTKGLMNAKVTNASEVYCTGNYGCSKMQLRNIGTLYATGIDAFSSSTLISERGESDGIMTASFDISGSNKDVNIYCNETDTCNITCVSSTACKDFTIYCDGICNIDCEDGYDCPEIKTSTTSVPIVDTTASNNDDNSNNEATEVIGESTESPEEVASETEEGSSAVIDDKVGTTVFIIDPITGEGESGTGGNGSHGDGHDCGDGGRGKYWWIMIVVVCVVIGVVLIGCCFSQYCNDVNINNNNNIGDDKQMAEIQRVTSTSIVVDKNGVTTTKENGGEDTENSKSSSNSNKNSRDSISENSLSGSLSSDKKLTQKNNGEV